MPTSMVRSVIPLMLQQILTFLRVPVYESGLCLTHHQFQMGLPFPSSDCLGWPGPKVSYILLLILSTYCRFTPLFMFLCGVHCRVDFLFLSFTHKLHDGGYCFYRERQRNMIMTSTTRQPETMADDSGA